MLRRPRVAAILSMFRQAASSLTDWTVDSTLEQLRKRLLEGWDWTQGQVSRCICSGQPKCRPSRPSSIARLRWFHCLLQRSIDGRSDPAARHVQAPALQLGPLSKDLQLKRQHSAHVQAAVSNAPQLVAPAGSAAVAVRRPHGYSGQTAPQRRGGATGGGAALPGN